MIRRYLFTLLRRTLGFWLGTRLLFLMLAGVSDVPFAVGDSGFDLTVRAALFVVLVTTTLVLLDARVAGEDVLLANFGIGRWQTAWPVLGLAAVLEALTCVLLILL